MARALYTLMLWLALPLLPLRLLWRARLQPEYLQHLGERFGFYPDAAPPSPCLWLHAVSVGETRAAQPLVRALLKRYPQHGLVLTCMTPTGRATARELYGGQARVRCVYLPYDYPFAMRRFLARFAPRAGLLMETEIWPNLVAACARAGVPIALVNARLSARSARGYRRFAALARPAFAALARVAAQTEADGMRLRELGAADVSITGNLKFDVVAAPDVVAHGTAWRRMREARADGAARCMFLCASTREGEEAVLLEALAPLVRAGHLLAIVPRHPQRFDEVARLIGARGFHLARRGGGESAGATVTRETEVWLGDSMGEMPAYYAAADCAYIGGSLLPFGGQNLIEACALGCPVLVGPHTYNFTQAADEAVAAGAALRVADAQALAREALHLLDDAPARERMAEAGRAFTQAHRGATERTMELIEKMIAQ